jgi:hypothetical protein
MFPHKIVFGWLMIVIREQLQPSESAYVCLLLRHTFCALKWSLSFRCANCILNAFLICPMSAMLPSWIVTNRAGIRDRRYPVAVPIRHLFHSTPLSSWLSVVKLPKTNQWNLLLTRPDFKLASVRWSMSSTIPSKTFKPVLLPKLRMKYLNLELVTCLGS